MKAASLYYPELPIIERLTKLHEEPDCPMGLINMGDGVFLDRDALRVKFERELEKLLAMEEKKMPRVELMSNEQLDKFEARHVWEDLDSIHFFGDAE